MPTCPTIETERLGMTSLGEQPFAFLGPDVRVGLWNLQAGARGWLSGT